MSGRSLCHVKDPGEVHRHDVVPFLGCNVQELVPDTDAGIIDEHVEATHDPNRIVNGCVHLS